MTDLATIEAALRKADAAARAGDQGAARDAKVLADAYRAARDQQQAAAPNHRGDKAGSGVHAFLTGVANAGTLGFRDEISAAADGVASWLGGDGFSEGYDRRLAHERAMMDQVRDENPIAAFGGEIAGSLVLPGAGLKAGATAGQNALRMAATGAAQGGAYGFGEGEDGFASRINSAAVPAVVGGAVGAAAPFALSKVQKALTTRGMRHAASEVAETAPSNAALRAEYKVMSDAAKARGVTIKESAYAPLVADVQRMAYDFGADPAITGGALAAVDRLAKKSGDVEWWDLEVARRVAANAARGAKPGTPDGALAAQIRDKIDDFVLNLVDGDLTQGSAVNLGKELETARNLWSRIKNDETISRAIEKGSTAKSGAENGIRNEFIKLKQNERFFKALSPDQQDAISQVIKGTTVGNILRFVGTGSAFKDQRAGFLGATLWGGAAAGAGGLPGLAAQQAASALAARGSEAITTGAAARAQSLARAGGVPMLPPPAQASGLGNALRYAPMPAAVGASWTSR